MKLGKLPIYFLLSVTLVFSGLFWFDSESQGKGGGGGGRGFSGGGRGVSYGKSTSWSSSTQGTWNRSGGGMLGPGSNTSGIGYTKPSLGGTSGTPATSKPVSTGATPPGGGTSSSGGYSKPTSPQTQGEGYSKPSSESQSSSSGYSKPAPSGPGSTPDVKPGDTKTSGGYAKPSGSTASESKFSGGSRFDRETVRQSQKVRSQESLQAYKSEQARFKNPEVKPEGDYKNSPLYDKAKVYSGFDYGSHYDRRNDYYKNQGYQPPPYAYNTSPGFGLFDSLFLFWMLDNVSNRNVAATAYHHADDPGFQKWRQDVQTLSKENAGLKTQLDELDKQIKSMEGVPKNPAYLPKGVSADLALAPNVLAEKKPDKPVLRFATGQPGGWYAKYGEMIKKAAQGFEVTIAPSNGSLQNLKMLASGEADMAIVQSDILAMVEKGIPNKQFVTEQSTLYEEHVQLIANRDSKIKSVKNIEPGKNFVIIGPKGSGTATTWAALCEQNPSYKKIRVDYSDYIAGLSEVENNPKALLLFVGGLNSDLLKKAEEKAKTTGKLRLVALDDSHFEDKLDKNGNTIYRLADISRQTYPALQKGWIFSGKVHTLAVQAVLVLRSKWAGKYGPNAMDALSLAILETKPEIAKMIHGIQEKAAALSTERNRIAN